MRMIASLLSRSGLEGPQRRLMESHVRMLERLSERAGSDPAIGLLAALARVDLAGKADTDPLFPDDPYIAANRRVTITLMHEAPPVPPDLKP